MSKQVSLHGSKGSERHQALIAWAAAVPYRVADVLGIFCFVTTGEDGDSAMAHILGTRGPNKPKRGGLVRLGGYYPDLTWELDDQVFVVEVGRYEPDRAPERLSVFHIAFDGKVSLINPTRENFDLMIAVAEELRRIVELSRREDGAAVFGATLEGE